MDRFISFADEASRAADHSLNFIKENLTRARKESITTIKLSKNKTNNVSFSGFKKERNCRKRTSVRLDFGCHISSKIVTCGHSL